MSEEIKITDRSEQLSEPRPHCSRPQVNIDYRTVPSVEHEETVYSNKKYINGIQ